MADWFIKQQNKALIESYPWLKPRKYDGSDYEDYDYDYILGENSLPHGWSTLYLMMCEDIRQKMLELGEDLNDVLFLDAKEKYGEMRVSLGNCPSDVYRIIDKYLYLSRYVCTSCGDITENQTTGYYVPLCKKCAQENEIELDEEIYPLQKNFTQKCSGTNGWFDRIIDITDIYNKYVDEINETKKETL